MWHLTCDIFWGLNILSKYQLPISYGWGWTVSWEILNERITQLVNEEVITKVFVEQPRLHRVCYETHDFFKKGLRSVKSLNMWAVFLGGARLGVGFLRVRVS